MCHITLCERVRLLAPGPAALRALANFAATPMIDVHLPTTAGRELILTRTKPPELELQLLQAKLKIGLPTQLRPTISTAFGTPSERTFSLLGFNAPPPRLAERCYGIVSPNEIGGVPDHALVSFAAA